MRMTKTKLKAERERVEMKGNRRSGRNKMEKKMEKDKLYVRGTEKVKKELNKKNRRKKKKRTTGLYRERKKIHVNIYKIYLSLSSIFSAFMPTLTIRTGVRVYMDI